jgi:hypothetical protein
MSSIITYSLAILTLFIYSIYISVTKGVVGLLLSMAIFLISCSFIDSMEYVTSVVVLLGLLYVSVSNFMKPKEGFNDANTGAAIVERVHGFEKAAGKGKVVGIQSVGSEGFEDVSKEDSEEDRMLLKKEENTGSLEGASPTESKPGDPKQPMANTSITSTEAKEVVQNIMKKEMGEAEKLSGKMAASPIANVSGVSPKSAASAAATSDGFEGAQGLFKLGQMPSETKSGPFVDVAATMGHAVNALQPEQMAAMTQESQKLMETQKSLMGMLQSMRPVLQDGRQLLDTFSGIFGGMGKGGGLGGVLPAMDQNAGKA